jgi:hypothetical protein
MDAFRSEADAILAQHKDNMDAAAARHSGLEKDLARFRYAADNFNMITGELMRLSNDIEAPAEEKTRIINQLLWAFVTYAKS